MAYSIRLDAGHGGQDPGAVYKGRQEKNDNLRLALAVGEILKNNGIDVSYTRTTDIYQTPFEKAQLANQAGVDYFISFNRNSSPKDNQYNGAEVLIYDKSGIKYQMAENNHFIIEYRQVYLERERMQTACCMNCWIKVIRHFFYMKMGYIKCRQGLINRLIMQ